jgi:hypothetical protein
LERCPKQAAFAPECDVGGEKSCADFGVFAHGAGHVVGTVGIYAITGAFPISLIYMGENDDEAGFDATCT